MAQHDYSIANQGFPATRADINNVLSAIATNNSGTSAPSTQYAGQFWIDTTSSTWTLYIHDGADDIQFATIDTSANTVNFIDSELGDNSVTTAKIADGNVTSAKLSYPLTTFSSTGIDDNATSTAITIDSSENVGIGTASPGRIFEVSADQSYVSIKSTNDSTGTSQIFFGDTADDNVGRINYDHSSNAMLFLTSASERMRIDSSGNVGIGTSSPDNSLHILYDDSTTYSVNTDDSGIQIENNNGTDNTFAQLHFRTGNADSYIRSIREGSNLSSLVFLTDNGGATGDVGEAMRIDSSGRFACGPNTTLDSAGVGDENQFAIYDNNRIFSASTSSSIFSLRASSGSLFLFRSNSTNVGSISITASSTAYNTSSDYRLKENVNYDFDATTRLKQLKPARFNFIADANTTVDGFIAHEVSSVVPEAISGEKDAVDENGNPEYQGIDQSKLVPLLVKTIQELEARITTLENA